MRPPPRARSLRLPRPLRFLAFVLVACSPAGVVAVVCVISSRSRPAPVRADRCSRVRSPCPPRAVCARCRTQCVRPTSSLFSLLPRFTPSSGRASFWVQRRRCACVPFCAHRPFSFSLPPAPSPSLLFAPLASFLPLLPPTSPSPLSLLPSPPPFPSLPFSSLSPPLLPFSLPSSPLSTSPPPPLLPLLSLIPSSLLSFFLLPSLPLPLPSPPCNPLSATLSHPITTSSPLPFHLYHPIPLSIRSPPPPPHPPPHFSHLLPLPPTSPSLPPLLIFSTLSHHPSSSHPYSFPFSTLTPSLSSHPFTFSFLPQYLPSPHLSLPPPIPYPPLFSFHSSPLPPPPPLPSPPPPSPPSPPTKVLPYSALRKRGDSG